MYTEPVPWKYGKLATKNQSICGYFRSVLFPVSHFPSRTVGRSLPDARPQHLGWTVVGVAWMAWRVCRAQGRQLV